VRGASDNTNLIQQILTIVQSIQAVIVGTDVSVASLQSQITAIKAKTDNLPADTNATLNQLKANIGSGPLNRMFMKTAFVNSFEEKEFVCSSSGPFLLHIAVSGEGLTVATLDSVVLLFQKYTNSHEGANFVVGGNPGQQIKVFAREVEGDSMTLLITMQTTEGAVVQCNEV
jgi:hypothetical protein